MNVSLNWLKEYVELDDSITIKEIVDRLTMSGSKVEKFEQFGKKTEKVFTAEVIDVKKHEEDDKLSILSLRLNDKTLVAVAKIPDIEIGDIVPVALPNAKVIGKEIKVSDVKGIKSECMICHILDLGLDYTFPWVKPSGLVSFPKDVKIGTDINEVLGLGDYIIEFEITPNRPDCLSVEGIANELALTFDKPCKKLWQNTKPEFNKVNSLSGITVKIETNNCSRYTMGVIDNVEIKSSKYDMQLKLIKSGIKPINNIVDITNYVMVEIGEPLHAFDLDVLNSNEILVRQANDGEKLQTLDKTMRNLDNSNMVITNGKVPVAIAGIMGGEISGITKNTKKVVLEAASFVRASIRNTSKKFSLRTDASSRYEKGLAPNVTEYALNRVCNIVNSTNSGIIGNNIVDVYPNKQKQVQIKLDYSKINTIIGTELSQDTIDKILVKTGIIIQNGFAKIPYNRQDLEIIEDLAEEIARIYGYDKLDSKLPDTKLTFGEKNATQKVDDKLKELAMANGYSETYMYTFFSKDLLYRMGIKDSDELLNCVKIINPLSQDFEYMRTTTMPLMLEALERNYTKKNEQVKLFELGKVFLDADNIKKGELCTEKQVLTLGMYDEKLDFYDFKSVIENILNYFKVLENDYSIQRIENKCEYHPGISASIVINGDIIAEFGKLSPKVGMNYILPENTYISTISFDNIVKYAKRDIKFVELPKFPAVERDLAFVTYAEVLAFDIEKMLLKIKNVESVKLFDVYQGKQIEQGKKSMAYNILLRSHEKTLEDTEISNTMEKVIVTLKEKFNADIRS